MWEQVNQSLRESVSRVVTSLAGLLPGLLAFAVAVLLAAAVGLVARWVLVRLLGWFRFDQRLELWGAGAVAEWSPGKSPARLVGQLVCWIILLLGVLVGLAALDATFTSTLLGRLLTYLPNVFVAFLLVLVGAVLSRFLSRGVLISAVNLHLQSARLLSLGVKWLVLVLTAAMALDHLSIGGTILELAFGILFGGIVLALALAVGLGSTEMVSRTWARREEKRVDKVKEPIRHL